MDSCQYDSVHQKSFAMFCLNLDISNTARCDSSYRHIPVQGVYTCQQSTPELVAALAWSLAHAIHSLRGMKTFDKKDALSGLEKNSC